MIDEVEIVTCGKRTVVKIVDFEYVYIPMTKQEAKKYAPDVLRPCWRIKIYREITKL